jgi:hypothetical protein
MPIQHRDFSHEFLFAGKTFEKKMQSKVKLKNTGLRQNKKYFGGKMAQFWEEVQF